MIERGKRRILGLLALSLIMAACQYEKIPPDITQKAVILQEVPRSSHVPYPSHVVVTILENRAFEQFFDDVGRPINPDATFINSLARDGAVLTHSSGVAHPSQPNYLALFSGDSHQATDGPINLDT